MTFLTAVACLLIAAGTSEPTADTTVVANEKTYEDNACVVCHRAEGGRLAEMVDQEWALSVHKAQDVPCEQCHGGDATLSRDQFTTEEEFKEAAHATFRPEFLFLRDGGVDVMPEAAATYACRECHTWTTEGRMANPHGGEENVTCLFKQYGGVTMSRERGIAYICMECHPESTEKHLGSQHGSRGAPSCLFCHSNGTHKILPAQIDIIDPRPREEMGRCSLCHQPSTMPGVAHIRETLEETQERMKAASQQFKELRTFGYRNLALGEMHRHVDGVRLQLRQVQHGCNIREIDELAKSIENVCKRVDYDHRLVTALHEARQRQTNIALGVAGLLMVLVGSLLLYRRAFGARRWSWTIRDPVRRNLTPPCNDACPAGNNVQGFIAAVAKEEYDKALGILLETTPFPSVCGRVCPAPCMEGCNRRLRDEGINIRELERYVGDHGSVDSTPAPARAKRVAVVGAGPAGLSATYQLAKLGYPVTLIERDKALGGVMRTGIPPYRLPRDVLDREIARILDHGVTVRTDTTIGKEDILALSGAFAAVVLAPGLQSERSLDLGGPAESILQQGMPFLSRAQQGKEDLTGLRIVVIGGGNAAIDVARTSIRLGAASVRMYCLETRDEMPASIEEIEEAEAEGVDVNTSWGPKAIVGPSGKASQVEFRRCVSVFDPSGRFAPTFDDNTHVAIPADRVILSLGSVADFSILPEGAKVFEGQSLLGTTESPVLVAGDFATGGGQVTGAIGSGRRTAWHIHRMLTGEDLFPASTEPVATPDNIKMYLFPHANRQRGDKLTPETRRAGFDEVQLGLRDAGGDHQAHDEAGRCFSCGVCNQCDRCVTHCPEGVVIECGDERRVDLEHCRGCGTCAGECPRGVIYMSEWQMVGGTGDPHPPETRV